MKIKSYNYPELPFYPYTRKQVQTLNSEYFISQLRNKNGNKSELILKFEYFYNHDYWYKLWIPNIIISQLRNKKSTPILEFELNSFITMNLLKLLYFFTKTAFLFLVF